MSTSNRDLLLTLKAKDLASQDVGKLEKALGGVTKAGIMSGVGLGVGAAAFGLVAGGVHEAVASVGEWIKKAEEEQVVSARLDAALKSNVVGWNGNREAINKYIDGQTSLGFTNAETTASLAQLVAATGSVTKAQQFQAAAMDLARLKGISLAEASDGLTKVEAGSYRILKSLGIELAKGATQTQALAAVQKIAAGQAQAFADTTAGAMDVMNAKLDQAEVKIGKHLIPIVTKAAEAFGAFADGVGIAIGKVDDLGGDLTKIQHGSLKEGAAGVKDLGDQIYFLTGGLVDIRPKTDLLTNALTQYGGAGHAADQITADLAHSMTIGVNAADLAAKAVTDLAEATAYARIAQDKAAPSVRNYFRQYSNAGSAKGDVAQAKLDIMDAAKAVRDAEKAMEKATPGTQKYRRAQLELAVAQGNLSGAVQTLTDKQSALFLLHPDKANREALTAYFKSIGLGVLGLSGDALDAYNQLKRLLGVTAQADKLTLSTSSGKGPKKQRASGGPVLPGETYTVGEAGQETLVMDRSGGGYVIPHSGGGGHGGGGAPVVIKMVLPNGRVLAEMVNEHLYWEYSRSSPSAIRK